MSPPGGTTSPAREGGNDSTSAHLLSTLAAEAEKTEKRDRKSSDEASTSLSSSGAVPTSSTASSSVSEKAASQDAADFFARAKAMGLNLTRQDYERARAGVSAFLRAQRVDKGDSSPVVGESAAAAAGSTGMGGDSQGNGERGSPAVGVSGSGSGKMASHSRLSGRALSSPMLSFFTAVMPSEEEGGKMKPNLDDVVAMEERKRRREKRRRARERREGLEGLATTGSASSHAKQSSFSSTTFDGSPLTSVSTETPTGRSQSLQPSSNRIIKVKLLSNESLQGLGLQMADGCALPEEEGEEITSLNSPVRLSEKPSSFKSPGLQRLSQKAHIDLDGHLTLLPSPAQQLHDHLDRTSTEDEEQLATANTGAETDDSGVFFAAESATAKKQWSRGRRSTSADTSPTTDLHTSLDRLSFLDRVMAQKASPLRLKREARAREAGVGKGHHDLVVMTAAPSVSSSQAASQPSESRPAGNRGQDSRGGAELQPGKNVRWATDSSSPRRRMTTKEHYDFAFYGISPNAAEAGAAMPTFEDDVGDGKRNGGEDDQSFHLRQRTTSAWMKSHLPQSNFGSPVAVRGPAGFHSHESPGILSISLESMADRMDNFGGQTLSAKRGLLFGPPSNDRTPPGLSTQQPDQAEATAAFSQGPTLARSPARNVFESFTASTPPKLIRANTLATPFSLHQHNQQQQSVEESPDRVMLMRAHSSGALDRRLPSHSRQASLLAKGANKENVEVKRAPAGWAHRSPMSKFETISPAAIFGSQQRLRAVSGEGVVGVVEPSKAQRHRLDEVNSDEEGDDEREMDVSPAASGQDLQQSPVRALGRKGMERKHTRDSSASTSAFDDSPLYLDIQNRTASVVSTLSSSSSLARALGMSAEGTEAGGSSQERADPSQLANKVKATKRKQPQQRQSSQQAEETAPLALPAGDEAGPALPTSATSLSGQGSRMEWDKPDGSRVVKLVSEELQAALESGTMAAEPPSRYYKLPPEWGRSSAKPQSVSYAGMIGQAILSSSDGRLSLNEIYNWISTVFPFFERGDRGWQNSIRHNLSLNKSFIKVERDASIPGKGGWWAIKTGHEDRFRGGSYFAPGSTLSHRADKAAKSQQSNGEGAKAAEEVTTTATSKLVRKRQESERSEGVSEHPSDSDYHPPSGQAEKAEKKRKKVKVGKEWGKTNGQEPVGSIATSKAGPMSRVGLQAPDQQTTTSARVPLRPVQSSSPKDVHFDTITPSRPHQFMASSSGHGSTSTNSMMATMPMLTDASSPPSSPNQFDSLMPPPSGGVYGAASSQSARKRKQAVNRAVDLMNGNLSIGAANHSTGQGAQSIVTNVGSYNSSLHTLQASPLAHMRGNSGSSNANLANNARLRAGPGHSLINAMDSPLRRHSNGNNSNSSSPSRLYVNSPISSLRASAGNQSSSVSMERSTSADGDEGRQSGAALSPMRGSPLRSGNQFVPNQQGQQGSSMFLSPAGMHLQMALGQNSSQQGVMQSNNSNGGGASQFLNFGAGNTPNRYSDQNAGNFLYTKWGLSPSPTKPMRFQGGNLYSQAGQSSHQSNSLEDPFDYSGNLQHELEMATELGQLSGVEAGESPMKMAYSNMARLPAGPFHSSAQTQQQYHHQHQQQQQQQVGHLTPNYGVNLAASNMYGLHTPFKGSHGD